MAIKIKPEFAALYRVLAFANAALSADTAAYENLMKYYKYSVNKDLVTSELAGYIKTNDSKDVLRVAAQRALADISR